MEKTFVLAKIRRISKWNFGLFLPVWIEPYLDDDIPWVLSLYFHDLYR